jgi:hypothetical protein
VLAAFDLLTVCATLYLSHRVNAAYTESLRVNREWAEMLSRFSDLGELATKVNAPGNDAFDSHDVPAERSRVVEALAAFNTAKRARRSELSARPAGEDFSGISRYLDETDQAMTTMIGEANLIFGYFEDNQPEQVGLRMATMDRKFAVVNTSLASLRKAVSDVQVAVLARQGELAAQMRAYEFLIGLLVALMVIFVAFYGHYMGKQAERAAALAHVEEEAAMLKRADDRHVLSEGVSRIMQKGSLDRGDLIAEVNRLIAARVSAVVPAAQ